MIDYYTPQKAVVIAASRVGSTMLCNALDSHSLISCDRTEPINPKTSIYLKAGLSIEETLGIVLGRPGYQWAMCKVSYRQLRKHISIQRLSELGVTKFIHLWRENPLRVVVSAALNTAMLGERPTHTWETPPLQKIVLDGQEMLDQARLYLERVEARKLELQAYETLTLTYESIISPVGEFYRDNWFPDSIEDILAMFLNTESAPLEKIICRINPYPLSEIILNWEAVRPILLDSEFAQFVESEDHA